MKKICTKCMSRYEGETCPLCASIENENKKAEANGEKFPSRRVMTEKEKKNQRNMLIVLCIIGVIFILFVLYRNGYLGRGAYTEPIEKYFSSICERDFDTYISIMPSEIADDTEAERIELGYEKAQYLDLLFADYFEEFGSDMTVSLVYGDISVPKETVIDAYIESYTEIYGTQPNAAAFRQVDVSATFSGSASTATIELECFVMRDGLTWYMVGCDYKTEEISEEDYHLQ